MSENLFKIARDLTKDINYRYPNTFIQLPVFDGSLKRFFDEETQHGTVYVPSNRDGNLCINLSAFIKGLRLIYAGSERNSAKTIEAKTAEKNLILRITIHGEPPSRTDLAVISKIMYMAGFNLTSYKNEIQLVSKMTERYVFSLYEHDIISLSQSLRYEFMLL